mgnify:CR=1 FL=1
MPPEYAVSKVAELVSAETRVLDVGTELGKNAQAFLNKNCRVTLMDISAKAIELTRDLLKEQDKLHLVEESLVCSIEEMPDLGFYHAIVSSYVFSFVARSSFESVLVEKVFRKLEAGGYFAAHFFGENHAWKDMAGVNTVSEEDLKRILLENDLSIKLFEERLDKRISVNHGEVLNHDFAIIAQKNT